MSDAKFDHLVTLCRAARFMPGSREADLYVADETILLALNECLSDPREYSVTLNDGNPDALSVGSRVRIEIGTPRTGLGLLSSSLDDLLAAPKHRVSEPQRYYLVDACFNKPDTPIPTEIASYRGVLQFVGKLKKAAAYLDAESATLVFVDGGKYELPVDFTCSDLKQLDAPSLDRLLSFLANDSHDEQKLAILEGAIRAVTAGRDRADRFKVLLANLADLASKANDGYRLFVASFSYDKVRDTLEAAKVEYATKIHKAFSDIQNQILGLPVATIIVASQMKDAKDIGYEFWLNSAVLVGCWVFCILMGFLLLNQAHTLTVLADEIARQRDQIAKQYKDIATRFSDVFDFLSRRLRLQFFALYSIGAVLLIGLCLAHVIYWNLTTPVRQWVAGIAVTLSRLHC